MSESPLGDSPLAWPIAPALACFSSKRDLPSVAEIDRALGPRAGVRFVVAPPRGRRRGPLDPARLYDARITLAGEVPTREQNLHDFMNALVWASYPRAKLAVHRRQHDLIQARIEGARLPDRRTAEQDDLAMLDEGGITIVTTHPEVVRAATHSRDAELLAAEISRGRARAAVFGHALYEHLARANASLVWGRAVVLEVAAPCSELGVEVVDRRLAEAIAEGHAFAAGEAGSAPLLSSVLC